MSQENITQKVLDTSRELEKFLNDDLLKRFGNLHNIDPKYNRFFLKQEIVARGAYFLNVKKKYALHITNQEGVDVDEMDVKGLVTRRSDYPSYPKEKIAELLELLVSEDFDRKKIRELVDRETEIIRKKCEDGLKEIARPVSYTKDKKDYKKEPIQIIGMDFWNEIEYEHFFPGTKGYLFKITGVDFNIAPKRVLEKQNQIQSKSKLQYIVLPMEEEKLPDYYIIDVNAMLKFAWTDRINELLEAEKSNIYEIKNDYNDGLLIWD